MTLTLETLKAEVQHALGGEPAAPHTTENMVNRAGTHLFTMHEWRFATRDPYTLKFVADEPRVELPEDFGRALRVRSNGSQWIKIVGVPELSLRAIENYESSALAAYYGTIIYPVTEEDTPHIYVTPTPTSADSDVARLWYRAGWIDLYTDTARAGIPTQVELLLIDLVREVAKGYDEDNLKQRLQAVSQSMLYLETKRWDGQQQPAGVIQGGHWDKHYVPNTYIVEDATGP
jgi:hypothetical protein